MASTDTTSRWDRFELKFFMVPVGWLVIDADKKHPDSDNLFLLFTVYGGSGTVTLTRFPSALPGSSPVIRAVASLAFIQ